jgi:hypothetical protein
VAHNLYRQDRTIFDGCPGRPDEERFVAHGVNLRTMGNGRYLLYVVSHGGRESVEAFEIDARPSKPTITWIGCVLTPPMSRSSERLAGNSVAPMPNDAFALSVNPIPKLKDPLVAQRLYSGQITGLVMIWRPKIGWEEVPGSEVPIDNGVEVSSDGRWLYVSASAEPAVYRLSLGRLPVDRAAVKTSFFPDNVRWGDDGFLYATGTAGRGIEAVIDCASNRASCAIPFKVARIDPRTLQSEELVNEPGSQLFGLSSGVAKVGEEIWVSTPRGTRIAIFPLIHP